MSDNCMSQAGQFCTEISFCLLRLLPKPQITARSAVANRHFVRSYHFSFDALWETTCGSSCSARATLLRESRGIGDGDPNKQNRKCNTFALLATFFSSSFLMGYPSGFLLKRDTIRWIQSLKNNGFSAIMTSALGGKVIGYDGFP